MLFPFFVEPKQMLYWNLNDTSNFTSYDSVEPKQMLYWNDAKDDLYEDFKNSRTETNVVLKFFCKKRF